MCIIYRCARKLRWDRCASMEFVFKYSTTWCLEEDNLSMENDICIDYMYRIDDAYQKKMYMK